jgi:hypothetical protein
MSYDLAVWEGERPADDAAALDQFIVLTSRYLENHEAAPPTPAIQAFVAAMLERWVDLSSELPGDDSPFAAGPLIGEASGPIIYFALRYSAADDVSAAAARIAASHDLICFDPQQDRLRPGPEEAGD